MEAREEPEERRAGWGFWLLLALPFLAFSAYFSSEAPCGRWKNQVLGVPLWMENDPSGSYIASAHELFTADPGPLFPGHPGTTLQLLLFAQQHLHYAVAGEAELGFSEFTARNIARVTVLAKLLTTCLHLVSFVLVYHFARLLLGGERGARLAALGYATTFPVLYYVSRVSVEPLMTISFAATFLALWGSRRAYREDRRGRGDAFAALAAFAAISGLVTKLHFFGPLPIYALLYLLVAAAGARLRAAVAYVVSAGVSLALYSTALDWGALIALWKRVGQIQESATRSTTLIPGLTPGGLFPLTEVVFLAFALVGLVLFLRRHPRLRRELAWVGAFAGFSFLVWGYRVVARGWDFRCFHYLFLVLAFLAPFFGYAAALVLERARLGARARLLAGVVLVLVVHGVALWAATDSRRYDAKQFQMLAEINALTPELGPDEGVVLLQPKARQQFRRMLAGLDPGGSNIHGLSLRYAPDGARSRLVETYAELFPRMKPADVPDDAPRGTLGAFGQYALVEVPR